MKERFKLSISQIWLLVTAAALILPVFLPSSANPQNFLENVIGTVTVTMFILSFPISLFGLPIMFFASYVLGVNPNTIGGMYLNIFLLCVLGYVQWFWILPRILRNEPHLQMLNLFGGKSEMQLLEAKAIDNIPFCDSDGRTPLERVLLNKDSE
ncbi:MAG: hypothetical protein H0U50_13670 [Pyrinomonadaceae bacterium]|nr:hypothetical protein [Pyrinomonadaceae bacterium]